MPRQPTPTTETARKLRALSSWSERLLWARLRARRLGGYKFVQQHPIGPYFADFVCRAEKLIVEVDGDMHAETERMERDGRRTAFLEAQGYRVIRFWTTEVKEGMEGVLERILAALRSRH
jgi:very-short-patch-repair endonuclease